MNILLSPHNDDESLFAAFTCQREKPLVLFVYDCDVQAKRQPSVTADMRRKESLKACQVLGVHCAFLGVPDVGSEVEDVYHALKPFRNDADRVWAPLLQGGHKGHDDVALAAAAAFGVVNWYSTYSKTEPFYSTVGAMRIAGTERERQVKKAALACYKSQHVWSMRHFAIAGEHLAEFMS